MNELREFGKFRLDAEKKILWHEDEPISLPLKEIELLLVLTETNELVTKEEILNRVWHDSFVEESNLSSHIYRLRKMFAKYGESENLIRTVPKRGYRFTGEVIRFSAAPELIIEKQTLTQTLVEEIEPPLNVKQLPPQKKHGFAVVGLILLLILSAAAIWAYFRNKNAVNAGNTTPQNTTITSFGFQLEKARAVAVQPDGKIVVGGWAGENEGLADFAIARYNADGSLDKSFGKDGKIITEIGTSSDVIYDLAIQPDGKIVAVGVSFLGKEQRRFCITRYKPDGSLDAAFNGNGIVILNVGTRLADTAYSVVIQPDGKIIVAGSASNFFGATNVTFGQNDFALIRLTPAGSLDTDFGTDGKTTTHFGDGGDIGYDVAIQLDGKILIGGSSTNGKNNDFAIVRYNSNGSLDMTFGSDGKVRTDFHGEDDSSYGMFLMPNGKIMLAGYTTKNTQSDFAVAQYLSDGSLDSSFNGNGKMTIDIERGDDIAFGIKAQADGKIIVGGQANTRQSPAAALARILPDGQIDKTFYQSGRTSLKIKERSEVWAMALHPENFAVLVGNSGDGKTYNFAASRFPLE